MDTLTILPSVTHEWPPTTVGVTDLYSGARLSPISEVTIL